MKLRDPYVHDMRNRYERVPEHEPMQQEKKKKALPSQNPSLVISNQSAFGKITRQ